MNPLVPVLNRISLRYGCSPVRTDTFAAEDFLEFRVGLFMERMDALRGGGKSIDIAKARARTGCMMTQHCTSRVPTSTSTDSVPPAGLICLCRMPVVMGETPVMSQCDSCDRWFHPNCTNALLVSRSASQTVESFECPLCLHARGRPSNFAFKPISEWRVSIHSLQGKKGKPKGPANIAPVPVEISKPSKKETVKTKNTLKSNESELSRTLKVKSVSGNCRGAVNTLKADRSGAVSGRESAHEDTAVVESSVMSIAVGETLSDPAIRDTTATTGALSDDLFISRNIQPSAAILIPNTASVLGVKDEVKTSSACTAHAHSHPPAHLPPVVPTSKPALRHQKTLKKQLSRDPMTVLDVTAAMAAEKELKVHKVKKEFCIDGFISNFIFYMSYAIHVYLLLHHLPFIIF